MIATRYALAPLNNLNTGGVMTMKRFGDAERSRAVYELEKALNVKLIPIRPYKKWLRDNDGNRYCLVGGYGDWHGIPSEVLSPQQERGKTQLVVVRMLKDKAELYIGPLDPLVENKHMLPRSSGGEYHFNIRSASGGCLRIMELSGYSLKKILEFPCLALEKEDDKHIYEAIKKLQKLPPQAREALITRLQAELAI